MFVVPAVLVVLALAAALGLRGARRLELAAATSASIRPRTWVELSDRLHDETATLRDALDDAGHR